MFLIIILGFIYFFYDKDMNLSGGASDGSSCVSNKDCAKGLLCQEREEGIPTSMIKGKVCSSIGGQPFP